MHQYQWSKCGKLFNVLRGTMIKKVVNGGSIGYWLPGGFITIERLRGQVEKIPDKEKTPF